MTTHDNLDDRLQQHFAAQREADARQAPPFAEVMARARAATLEASATSATVAVDVARPESVPHARRRWVWAAAAAPLAVAAGLAIVWLSPARSADREFEQVVAEWSRVERSLTLPSDGLLAVPGSEYLRRLPALGGGAGATRRPM